MNLAIELGEVALPQIHIKTILPIPLMVIL